MARIRLSRDQHRHEGRDPAANHPGYTPATFRGLTERQWFIGLLVVSGLLLLITFRGCILPSGVGPKSKPAVQPTGSAQPVQPASGPEYTVQAGDTLSKIAQKFNVSVEQLAQANNIDLNSRVILRVGQTLKIPQPTP